MYFSPLEIIKASEEIGFRNVILATSTSESVELIKERYNSLNKKESLIAYHVGIHAEYTTPIERIKEISLLVNELKAPFYTHSNETLSEVNGCVDRYGLRHLHCFLLDQHILVNCFLDEFNKCMP